MAEIDIRDTSLFKDMDDSFSRQCEWSYPKSVALLGGKYSAKELSDNYLYAAETLCSGVQRNDIEDYKVVYPILFLFRHAIELRLKILLEKQRKKSVTGHDLWKLVEQTDFLKPFAKNWIYELNQIDQRSTGLRYHNKNVNGFEIGCEINEFVKKLKMIADEIDNLLGVKDTTN